eukprot:TRINITY_DN1050_c3_g1_i1.p1 TRINITY_DN1050_c3_g1~~TRINITY_DN1050_c3_g1_i1.p1  ORF type:complete len:174 (-),score=68.90 TRINITY_DN1050_c3_g1_i1:82-603(-)
MSYRGRGRGRGGRGGRSDFNNPDSVKEFAVLQHGSEKNQAVFKQMDSNQVPKFSSPVFLQNKTRFGQIDEIFGPINNVHFSVNLDDGYNSSTLEENMICYISPDRLLYADMFDEEKQKARKKSRGGRGGRGRGGRGRGGRGRGGSRGRGGRGRGGRGRGGRGRGGRGRGRGRY